MGEVLASVGNLAGAAQVLSESLRYARIENDAMLRAYAAFCLARIDFARGNDSEAIAGYRESLEELNWSRTGDRARTQGSLLDCSQIALRYRHPRLATVFLAGATQAPFSTPRRTFPRTELAISSG